MHQRNLVLVHVMHLFAQYQNIEDGEYKMDIMLKNLQY